MKRSPIHESVAPETHIIPASQYFTAGMPFYIARISHSQGDFPRIQRRQREFWKIVYVLSGEGRKIVNDRTYPLGPGAVYIIHPDDRTSYQIGSKEIVIYNILFMPELFGDEIKTMSSEFAFYDIFYSNYYRLPAEKREALSVFDDSPRGILRALEEIEDEYTGKKPNWRDSIRFKMLDLLIKLSREASSRMKRVPAARIAAYIDHFISERYREDITLDSIAAAAGLHRNYVGRAYKRSRRMTIFEAINRFRVQRACELMATEKAITDICYDVGFNDVSFFYRMFKRYAGMPPGDWRRSKTKNIPH
ncbi:MAG: AraC family transcriptional regulator [Spirochaetota bacterium]